VRVIIESSAQRGWAIEPGRLVVPEIAAVLTILCGRGAEDERQATRSILDHRVLQIESFERNVAACAVGAYVFEIAVGNPVIGHGVAGAIVQHQQEDSLAHGPVFGRCAQRGSGVHPRIPFCCVVIQWNGSGRDRGHSPLRRALGIEIVAEIKRVSAEPEAGINRIKGTGEGKAAAKMVRRSRPGSHRCNKHPEGKKTRKTVEEETATKAHSGRNERNSAVGAGLE
jgi:hypothetical protein